MSRRVVIGIVALGILSLAACSGAPDSTRGTQDNAGDAGPLEAPDAAGTDAALLGDADAGPAAPPPTEAAGSRLKPLYQTIQTSDGASGRWFIAWQDTMRNEPCYPQRLSDGKFHCAPIGQSLDFADTDTYFLDAQCTSAIVGIRKTRPSCPGDWTVSDKYVTRYDQNPQCSATHVYAAPSATPLTPSTVYLKNGSNCTSTSGAYFSSNWNLYAKSTIAALTELAPSDLVEMKRTEETTIQPNDGVTAGSRIHPVIVKTAGADGSYRRALEHYLDYSRSEFCFPGSLMSDGKLHCAPSGSWFYDESFFSDPSCTQPAIKVDGRQPSQCERDDRNGKYLMSRDDTGSCSATRLFQYPTGGTYSEVYQKWNNQCSDVGATGASNLLFAKTTMAELAPSSFVDFTMSYVDGSAHGTAGTRLAPMSVKYDGADGFSFRTESGQFRDKQSQTTCSPVALTDGQLHCVPPYAWLQYDVDANVFADAACTQAIVGVQKSASCGRALPSATLIAKQLQVNGCGAMKLFPLPTTSVAPAAIYRKNGQSCTEDTANGPNMLRTIDFYPASAIQGSNVDPSTFPALTLTFAP